MTNEQVHSANPPSTACQLIPIFISPDHIGQLKEAIRHLFLTNPAVPTFGLYKETENGGPPSPQPMADNEEHVKFDEKSLQTFKADESLDSLNLTVSSPPSPVLSRNSVSLSKKKYYVITIGKCTGVFYGEWYVNLISCWLFSYLTFLPRDNISHLVLRVSGAKYKGFLTKEKANNAYSSAKQKGEICIVRNPRDDKRYGPMFYAIQ